MDRESLDNVCEKTILGLVIAILIFAPLALGGLGTWQFLVIEGLTGLAMLTWAVRLCVAPSPKLLFPPVCWVVLAFMAYTGVRWWQSDLEYVARLELIRVTVYGVVFFLVLNNLYRQESVQAVALTLIFLAMALCFYAGWQYISPHAHVWSVPTRYPGRGSGTFIYPNHFAGFLELLFPIALAYVLIGRMNHLLKIVLGYCACVMLAGIAITLSRGGWAVSAAALVTFCLILLTQRDNRLQGAILLAGLVAVGLVAVPRVHVFKERVADVTQSGKADNLRFSIWQPAVEMWRDNFWLGVGPAGFNYRFGQYRPPEVQLQPDYAHNDYLNTLADYGLIGGLLVAATLMLIYHGVLRSWRAARGGQDDFARKKSNKLAFLIGASVGLFAILLHSLVDFNLHMPANALLTVTLLALLASYWRFKTEQFWFRVRLPLRAIIIVLLLGILGGWGYAAQRTLRAERWHRVADRSIDPANPYNLIRIQALEKAFAADPKNFELSYEIADLYRARSWYGNDDYIEVALKALPWYRRGMALDPYDALNWIGYGRCLDWIGRTAPEKSGPYFGRGNELDLNSAFVTANIGWHYAQNEDWPAARTWFTRSQRLQWVETLNPLPFQYLPVVENRLHDVVNRNK